jgi:hypothetical protein
MAANPHPVPQGPKFSLVFTSVLGITLLCLGIAVYLALLPQSDAIKSLDEKVLSVFTLGCGAIIGLLSSRKLS